MTLSSPTETDASPAPPPRVVVAEDDPLTRTVIVEALTDEGFDVLPADSADDALRIIGDHPDDIQALFTDVAMPGSMNGLELARRVRRDWPRLAVLIASGEFKPSYGALPSGSRFLPKPYRLAAVSRNIRELIAA